MTKRYEASPSNRNILTPYRRAAALSACALFLTGCNNQNQLPDYGTEPVVVQSVDTLTEIALRQLQECDRSNDNPDNFISSRDLHNTVDRIMASNDLSDPSSIAAQQVLEIPVLCEANAVSPDQPTL